jgi:hypothetical protein
MNKRCTISILFLVFLGYCQPLFPQENQIKHWVGISLRKTLNKEINLYFDDEIRWSPNYFNDKYHYSEAGLKYEINKYFRVGVFYRFAQKGRQYNYSTEHRLNTDVELQYQFYRTELEWRGRYLTERIYYDEPYDVEQQIRNKVLIAYNLYRTSAKPYIGYELYHRLQQPGIENQRFHIGVEYNLTRKIVFELGLKREKGRINNMPANDYNLVTRIKVKL